MIRRFGLIGVLALSMLVVSAPSSLSAFPARSGTVAYQEDDVNPDTGMTELSAISSIPRDSSANCADNSPAGDQGAPCSIGRFGYSPDGKRIVAERSGRLEVLDANGQNVRILPALTSQDSEPAFLRGGSTIVFTGVAKGAANLYTVNPDGSGLEQLTTKGGSWPAPCANGSIAFINHGALYLRRANGSGLRRLARHASTPDCAPNSKSILFEGPGTSKRALAGDFIVNTTGGTRRIKGQDGSFPVFSPDGRFVASVQDLPDQQTGGYSVPSVVVVVRKNGHRVRKVSIGNNLGTAQFGPVAWRPKR
jgi:Tol biopolymer transport system component